MRKLLMSGLVAGVLLLNGCASQEVEFRDFATLTDGELKSLKAELAKPKPAAVALKSGQKAQCTKQVCHVAWVSRSLSLHSAESEVRGKKASGTFTLEGADIDALLSSVAAAAESKSEETGRLGNLGHACSAKECKLSVFVPAGENEGQEAAAAVLRSTRKGKVFRE